MSARERAAYSPSVALTICKVVNSFGCGQHPMASDATVDGFAHDYVGECIARARAATPLTCTAAHRLLNDASAALALLGVQS